MSFLSTGAINTSWDWAVGVVVSLLQYYGFGDSLNQRQK